MAMIWRMARPGWHDGGRVVGGSGLEIIHDRGGNGISFDWVWVRMLVIDEGKRKEQETGQADPSRRFVRKRI